MNPKVAILSGIGLFAAALLIAFPARASACDFVMDDEIVQLKAEYGLDSVKMIDAADLPAIVTEAEKLTGGTFDDVTRGMLLNVDGKIALGLEIGGCLIPPVILVDPSAPKA